jgi:hypothetical protein
MRAILIDPEKQTLTEVQIDRGYEAINAALGCGSFTTGAFLNGNLSRGFDSVAVSDDDMEDRGDPSFWFQVDADRDPPSSFPIAGPGLAVGTDGQGEDCDVRIGIAELTQRVTFTRRKFRGFTVRTDVPGADLAVEMKAPIVDDGKDG